MKYSALTKQDASQVSEADLLPGSQLLLTIKGKAYAVTILVDKATESEYLYIISNTMLHDSVGWSPY